MHEKANALPKPCIPVQGPYLRWTKQHENHEVDLGLSKRDF